MARLPRLALAGHAHLVLLTAAQGKTLFADDTDRHSFVAVLAAALPEHRCALHAYALPAEQVLMLVTPAGDEGLSGLVQAIGRRYVAMFNRRHAHRGSLWEGRYRATIVEPGARTLDALLHIDLLASAQAGGPAWSSAPHHLGQRRDPLLTDSPAYWQLGNTPFDREQAYRQRLADGLPAERAAALAAASHKGWPLGSDGFIAGLAARTSRPLAPRRRGRPAKSAQRRESC
jgi:putative transposase